jgi:hypothetical protein
MDDELDYWQEQDRRAAEIRPILERTLAIAHENGLLEEYEGDWWYRGEEYTLDYHPHSQQLTITSNDHAWGLNWHEGLFIPSEQTHITDEQLNQFQEFGQWLERVENGILPEPQPASVQVQSQIMLLGAAQLFEYYASNGDEAFKFAPDSSEHLYRVQVEQVVYLISRDDGTGLYSLQREDGDQLSQTDEQIWENVGDWIGQLTQKPIQSPPLTAPYWEQQVMQANQILPYARSLFDLAESTGATEYDASQQSYILTLNDYTLGYAPDTDVFWLERSGERLLVALRALDYWGDRPSDWSLDDLNDLGNLTHADVRWFAEWTNWLKLKVQEAQIDLEAENEPSNPHRQTDYER